MQVKSNNVENMYTGTVIEAVKQKKKRKGG